MKRKIYLLLLILVTVLFARQPTLACRCPYTDNPSAEFVAENYEKAVAVFSGEVIESDVEKVKFKIKTAWKGKVGDELEMLTGGERISENITRLPSSCDYNFNKSQNYLVFAFGKNLEDLKATKCSLTNELKKAENTRRLLDELLESKKKNLITKIGFSNVFNFTTYSPLFFPAFGNLPRD